MSDYELEGMEKDRFDTWFALRFQAPIGGGYYREWLFRYHGHGTVSFVEYMDLHTERIWNQVCRGDTNIRPSPVR